MDAQSALSPNATLLKMLQLAISSEATLAKTQKNFHVTFERLGMGIEAMGLTGLIINAIRISDRIEDAESLVRGAFERTRSLKGEIIFDKIKAGLQDRFDIMYGQLLPHLKGVRHTIDYGCGAGVLTQMLHDRLDMDIEGVDVRDFRASGVSVPISHFDGYRVPVADKHYECAVLTNVIHHEAVNGRILMELDRIAAHKLVIIETVPEGSTDAEAKADWGRMFLNDALWNRFFNYANIPCPGTYETPSGWERRFRQYGWEVSHSEDLGFDQPTIQDRHHLLVLER